MTRDEWIAAFAQRAGTPPPSAAELDAILALAGLAAHASERAAAPVACWIAGRSGRSLEELSSIAQRLAAAPPAPEG